MKTQRLSSNWLVCNAGFSTILLSTISRFNCIPRLKIARRTNGIVVVVKIVFFYCRLLFFLPLLLRSLKDLGQEQNINILKDHEISNIEVFEMFFSLG